MGFNVPHFAIQKTDVVKLLMVSAGRKIILLKVNIYK